LNTFGEYVTRMVTAVGIPLMAVTLWLAASPPAIAADVLYIGDVYDNSVKQFDVATGAFQGRFVKSQGGLHAPTGMIFDSGGNLMAANQNANTGTSGEILQYDAAGKLLNQIVKNNAPHAPFAPQGSILLNNTLFVADQTSPPTKSDPVPSGTLRKYLSSGVFLGAFVPGAQFTSPFHPRGIVLGPDGILYVSNDPNPPPPYGNGLGGQILRFNPDTGAFIDVFISDLGGVGKLNRPVGLVFGSDNKLYVTSFRADATDNDKVLIYQDGSLVDHIDLDVAAQTRTYAEALLFGPNGKLYVPITTTGEVRRYDVSTKEFDALVDAGGPLEQPWFLTFGKTRSASLTYP
jgi:hypothetical protein